jgi:hypothetical protein
MWNLTLYNTSEADNEHAALSVAVQTWLVGVVSRYTCVYAACVNQFATLLWFKLEKIFTFHNCYLVLQVILHSTMLTAIYYYYFSFLFTLCNMIYTAQSFVL